MKTLRLNIMTNENTHPIKNATTLQSLKHEDNLTKINCKE